MRLSNAVKYELIIFDLDGTLADSFAWFLGALHELAERHGLRRLPPPEVEDLRGQPTPVILQRLGVTAWKMPGLARALRKRMQRDLRDIALFDGIESMLQELARRDVILAVASSNSRENIEEILGPRNASFIHHYECGVSMFGKAARLRKVLRQCGVPATKAIFIGDELRDRDAARKAGVVFGAVAWGYAHPDALRAQSPEEMFSEVGEIVRKLG